MKFGPILRKARKMAGFSQEELAIKIDLPRSTVSKLENDKLELRAWDLIEWFRVTQAQELTALLLCGVDVTAILQHFTQILGGWILWLF